VKFLGCAATVKPDTVKVSRAGAKAIQNFLTLARELSEGIFMSLTAETVPPSNRFYEEIDRKRATYDDASTWLAETLPGSLRTSVEYHFDGHELYGRDGRPLAPVFNNAIIDAEAITVQRPNLVFELRRRKLESEEYRDMLAMARGETPNSMVVVSDFPAELQNAKRDIGGYNVARKQTMLRVITRKSDGKLNMTSQSLDLSDRSALEAIYEHFNICPKEGELLGQRIHADIAEIDQPYLSDRLKGIYDRKLAKNYGGKWYAGRPGDYAPDTYDFVRRQHDLMARYVGALLTNPTNSEVLHHDIAATMLNRLNQQTSGGRIDEAPVPGIKLEQEIARAATEARALGLVFSACGGSFGGDTEKQLRQAGYGNQTNESTSYSFSKRTYCRVCQSPPEKGDKPKMCGPCDICRACDFRLQIKTKAA
jgi:Mn-containing catalase